MEQTSHTIHIGAGTIIKTILVVCLFYILYILKDLVLVVLMSIVIASSIEPMTKWFVDHKIPRLLGVIFIYLTLASILAFSVFYLLLPLLSESTSVLKTLPSYLTSHNVEATLSSSGFLGEQSSLLNGIENTINVQEVVASLNAVIDGFSTGAFNTIAYVFGGVLSFVLMVVLSFYLSVDENGVGKFLRIITPLKHEKYVLDLWRRAQSKIGLWMQGQLILAIIIAMLVYLGLTLLNVPNALLLAFLAGLFEIIPLFGPILAAIPAVMIAFVSSGGISLAVVVIGLYVIIHQFENHLIYPLVVKKVTGVSPIVSIVALVAGWELAGFLGLIIAVPFAAVCMEFFDDVERNKIAQIEANKSN
ncbi:MAG: AI-2E family transporter [Candidatus Zambryskibacteria bacterium]|nr:AI-2E family transporter [Candidatus Zambryskibacteria bacterium]